MYNIAVVCEGPSDYYILETLLFALCPEVEEIQCLQPPLDCVGKPLDRTGGWSAVKQWCELNGPVLAELISGEYGPPLDALVIVLDVDIAIAAGIEDPPKTLDVYATRRLCGVVKVWLRAAGRRRIPHQVIIAIPAMAIEAWVIAVLFPRQKNPERLPSPTAFLVDKDRLTRNEEGKIIKPRLTYEGFGQHLATNIHRLRKRCAEANRFAEKIEKLSNRA